MSGSLRAQLCAMWLYPLTALGWVGSETDEAPAPEPGFEVICEGEWVVDASCDGLTVGARRLDGSVIETTSL